MPPLRGMGLIRKILCLREISDGLRRGGRETEKGDGIVKTLMNFLIAFELGLVLKMRNSLRDGWDGND